MSMRRLATCLLLVSATSCRGLFDHGDRACGDSYEYGSAGCFEVTGTVVGERGQPLAGMVIGPRYVAPPAMDYYQYDWSNAVTDLQGRFRVRATRLAFQDAVMAGGPDTGSVYVTAWDSRTPLGTPAALRDSVLTHVAFASDGAEPVATIIYLRLKVP
jgi:hypothetical protein